MAEETAPTAPEATGPEAGAPQVDHAAEAEKWKALARKHEDGYKAARTELDTLRATADTSKTEVQKLTEKVASFEAKQAEAELRALRAEVASDLKLPKALAARLVGATKEELEADGAELLKVIGKTAEEKAGPNVRTQPTVRRGLSGGGSPTPNAETLNPRELAKQIPRR